MVSLYLNHRNIWKIACVYETVNKLIAKKLPNLHLSPRPFSLLHQGKF